MRRLDFCVPHWQETPEIMTPLLDSIKAQRSVDLSQVGVIIAYDGPDATELPLDEWRETYPFAIEDVHPEKGGVSHTRNAAMDASSAEFLIFCDADDCLLDCRGLFIVFREMDSEPNPREMAAMGIPKSEWQGGFDLLISDFVEETVRADTGKTDYILHPALQNLTFVHSMVLRRQWLIDNDIRFGDALLVHEDSYFVIITREVVKPHRAKLCQSPWFLWVYNPLSVCRHDPDTYILSTFNNLIESNDAVISELMRRRMPEKANTYCVSLVWDAYFLLLKPEWKSMENQEYRTAVEKRFASYFRKHEDKWDAVPESERLMISQGIRQRSIMEGMLTEDITINRWLERITSMYPEAE